MKEDAVNISAGKLSCQRLAWVGILPLMAIILLVLTALPFWQYWQVFKEYRVHPVDADNIIAAAGIDDKVITEQERALLSDDWKKLRAAEPRNPIWFAQDFMSTCFTQNSWRNDKPIAHIPGIPPKLEETAVIDPGNALFDYSAAVEILYLGSEYDGKRHSGNIRNRVKLMEALPYFLDGLKKPRYSNYWREIADRRMQMAKYVSGARANIWKSYLYSASIYDYDFYDYFTQALPLWADELIRSGHPVQAEQLLDCWSRLALQYSQSSYLWQVHSLVSMIKDFHKTLPPLYLKLGKPDKAAAVGEMTDKISAMWLRRYAQNNDSPMRKSVMEDFRRYAPSSQQHLAVSLLPGEYDLADYATGLAREYAIGDHLAILITMLLLLSLLTGCGLAWLFIRFRLRQTLLRGLLITNWKSLAYLALFGVIIPLALWLLLTIMPSGGRNYAINYSGINFIAQSLFLMFALTLWPLALYGYAVEKRAVSIGLADTKHPVRHYLVTIAIILVAIAGIALFPWGGKSSLNLSTIIPQAQYIYNYDYYFAKPENPAFWIIIAVIALSFLLLPLLEAFRRRGDQARLLKAGATAAAFVIGASVIIIVLSVASRLIASHEENLLARDKVTIEQYRWNSPGDIATAECRQYLRRKLAVLPPVTVPQVTYTLTDNKSFCAMVISSPYSRLEEAVKQGSDVNAVDESGHTALMLACRYRDVQIIDLLLRHGAKVDSWCPPQPYSSGHNPEMLTGVDALMTAAFYNPDPAVIRLLLKHGADLNRCAKRGYSRDASATFLSDQMTAMMFAARHNNPAAVQALLDAGAKIPEQQKYWYKSLLEMACFNNPDPQVAMLLKKNGAE
ncbi:MAG: ankyrin repeat domain-containing protein, partial [Victivallaceae bacterium]